MGKTRKKEKSSLAPPRKKNLKNFCFEEEGKISKKSLAKAGLTLAMLGSAIETATANHSNTTHVNINPNHSSSFVGNGHDSSWISVTHASHPSHSSHGSHG